MVIGTLRKKERAPRGRRPMEGYRNKGEEPKGEAKHEDILSENNQILNHVKRVFWELK